MLNSAKQVCLMRSTPKACYGKPFKSMPKPDSNCPCPLRRQNGWWGRNCRGLPLNKMSYSENFQIMCHCKTSPHTHYDSVQGSPGANDNGTGVAAMLAATRVLKHHPVKRTLRFVAFTNEEPPFSFKLATWEVVTMPNGSNSVESLLI